MNSFLRYWCFLEYKFWLISVWFVPYITNMQKTSESLFNTALVQPLYYLLNVCYYSLVFPKVLFCAEFVFMFLQNGSFAASKRITTYIDGKLMKLSWLVAGAKIEQQQLSFTKFSLNTEKLQEQFFDMQYQVQEPRKRVQVKDIKQKKIKNLFLRY